MDREKNILAVYSKIGIIQILPVVLSLATSTFFTFAFIVIISIGLDNGMNHHFGQEEKMLVLRILLFYLICFSGLIAFLISSYHFIQAKRKNDFNFLIKGMKYLVWACSTLCFFTIVLFIFLAIEITKL